MKMTNEIAGSMGSYLHFRELGWEPILKAISEIGFKCVELSASHEWQSHIVVEQITRQEVQTLKNLLSRYNLRAISMSAHCDLSNKEGLKAFERRIDLAVELGIGILITGTGKWRREEDLDQIYENIAEISDKAKEHGLIVALETHGNGFTGESHTASGKHYLPIIKHINRDNIRICYDTANVIYYEGVRPEEDISYIENHLGYLHMKDKNLLRGVLNFPALGEGNVNFQRIFEILRKVNYTGPFSVEIELSPATPPTKLEIVDFNKAHLRSVEFLRNFFSSL